jgi:DNA repair protein RecN (Recombination protein N)
MLHELVIDDLLLIASARLQLAPGLNVITGETGAGKTLLAQALGLLMGQKADADLVRSGASRALVQAVFADGDREVIVGREIPREGRSRSFLDGLYSSAAAVEQTVRDRVAFYGQLEHARLLHLERQVDLLDASAPDQLPALLETYQAAFTETRVLEGRLRDLRAAAGERAREAGLLEFQVQEIEAAAPQPGEDEQLITERARQRNAEKLLERVGGALVLLEGEAEGLALDQLRAARRLVDEAAALDPSLSAAAERLQALSAELEDAAYGLVAYVEALDTDAERRDAVERRHDVLQALKRKYGATIEDVLEYQARSSERLAALRGEQADEEGLAAALAESRERAVRAASRLSTARRRRAVPFAEMVTGELQSLAMPHARFEVRLEERALSR